MNRSFIRYKNLFSKLLRFVKNTHLTDRQTDRQKGDSNTVRMHSQSHDNKSSQTAYIR